LADDPELRRRLGNAGRAFVERNHTFDAHASRVHTLYDFIAHSISDDHGA
ncbi:MAG: glycosyltransferase WbuB, partial [Gemmatimonadetes bacterium]|nr:glycosyltransferase WbuB [Gemmatimonadota bacterium]